MRRGLEDAWTKKPSSLYLVLALVSAGLILTPMERCRADVDERDSEVLFVIYLQLQLALEHQTVGRLPVWSVLLYPLGSYDSDVFTALPFFFMFMSCLFFFVLPHGPTFPFSFLSLAL